MASFTFVIHFISNFNKLNVHLFIHLSKQMLTAEFSKFVKIYHQGVKIKEYSWELYNHYPHWSVPSLWETFYWSMLYLCLRLKPLNAAECLVVTPEILRGAVQINCSFPLIVEKWKQISYHPHSWVAINLASLEMCRDSGEVVGVLMNKVVRIAAILPPLMLIKTFLFF